MSTRIKISPSQLNNFNRYLDESLEYETFERLIEKIVSEPEPSEKMAFGTACHKVLENPEIAKEIEDGFYLVPNDKRERQFFGEWTTLNNSEFKTLMKWHDEHLGSIYEKRFRTTYDVGNYEVVMSMIIDNMQAATIRDFKIVQSQVKTDDFMKSYQWRCYMDAMGLPEFEYHIWQRRGRSGQKELIKFPEIKLYYYSKLHEDVVDMISRYIEFLESQNLIHLFLYEDN